MSSVIPFSFEEHDVRVLTSGDQPWFVLADVCRVLEIAKPDRAASRLEDDEKGAQGAVARNQLLLWNHMHKDGELVTSPGLTKRRHAEWLVWAGLPVP